MLINIGVTIDQVDKDVGNEIQCPTQHLWGSLARWTRAPRRVPSRMTARPELQTWIAPMTSVALVLGPAEDIDQ